MDFARRAPTRGPPARLTLTLLALLLGSCTPGRYFLEVRLLSDFVPGVDFTRAVVEIAEGGFDGPDRFDERVVRDFEVGSPESDFLSETPLASFSRGIPGEMHVRVRLLEAGGRAIGRSQPVYVELDAARVVRVQITRSCDGSGCEAGERCHCGACVPNVMVELESSCQCVESACQPLGACFRTACFAFGCGQVDTCPEGERCGGDECVLVDDPDACDPAVNTPCSHPEQCEHAMCPPSCGAEPACQPGETPVNCPEDCIASCGDDRCDLGPESPCGCPDDCDPAMCLSTCGRDGTRGCDPGETPVNCPEDCGLPPDDSMCGETPDCSAAGSCERCSECCEMACGNDTCELELGETCETCADCVRMTDGVPEPCPVCGDAQCDFGDCPGDCDGPQPVCGDEVCDAAELAGCACQPDCGWTAECTGAPEASPATCLADPAPRTDESCGEIPEAYVGRSANVAYYPMVSTQATEIHTGDGWNAESPGGITRSLPAGAQFAAQSLRNGPCGNLPPIRQPRAVPDGRRFLFGYAIHFDGPDPGGIERLGWVDAAHLRPARPSDAYGACPDGPRGDSFVMAYNPYSRGGSPDTGGCEPMPCDVPGEGVTTCTIHNASDRDAAADCAGGTVTQTPGPLKVVTAETAALFYAPGVGPRRVLHAGDQLRVRYQGGGLHDFVRVSSTDSPVFNPPATTFGWVLRSVLADPPPP